MWIAFASTNPAISYSADAAGVFSTIVSILLLILATFRDYIFIQKVGGK
jgi:hypothetical protein